MKPDTSDINRVIIGTLIVVMISVGYFAIYLYLNVIDPIFWQRHLDKLLALPTREGNLALTCSNMIISVQDGSITSYWTCGEHNHTWYVSGMGTHVEFTFFYDGREGPYTYDSHATSLFSEIQAYPWGSLRFDPTLCASNVLFISLLHARNQGTNRIR